MLRHNSNGSTDEERARACQRFRWMRAANSARGLTPIERAAAISIALHFNVATGRCDPGYEAIAEWTPYRRRAVITAVAELKAKGWIIVDASRGRHRNNIHLTLPNGDMGVTVDEPNSAPFDEPNGARLGAQQCTVRGSTVHGSALNSARQNAHVVDSKPEFFRNIEENREENKEENSGSVIYPSNGGGSGANAEAPEFKRTAQGSTPSAPESLDAGAVPKAHERVARSLPPKKRAAPPAAPLAEFEAWWALYPRKVAKGGARHAYRTARSKVSAEVLLAGVRRYAAERANEDPKFTKHATTWLNQECWSDEPTPNSARPAHRPASNGRRAPDVLQDRFGDDLGAYMAACAGKA
jgi:hypothetical protein